MRFSSLILVASAALSAVFVEAQTTTSSSALPTSSAGLTQCILTCVSSAAASGGCSSFADISCVCTSQSFQSAATACLQSNCTAAELATAEQLQQQQCGAVSSASSISSDISSAISSLSSDFSSGTSKLSSALSSLTGTNTKTSATATSAGTSDTSAATSNAAAGYKGPFGTGTVLATVLGAFGFAVGALVV